MAEIYKNRISFEQRGNIMWETFAIISKPTLSAVKTAMHARNVHPGIASQIEHKFHSNSEVSYERWLGRGKPSSAYFISHNGKLYLMYGLTNETGESVLHDLLRTDPQYIEMRNHAPTKIRSGHIGTVTLNGINNPNRLALFDSLSHGKIYRDSVEHLMALTLLNNNILPVGTDGIPIIATTAVK